ncbi:olfactory receptor 14C36-like [Chlamydotis macqueenii]
MDNLAAKTDPFRETNKDRPNWCSGNRIGSSKYVGAHRESKPCSPQIQREEGLGCTALAGGRLALFSLSAAEMLMVSDIQGHSPGRRAQRQQLSNTSGLIEFLLLAFADTRELQLLHFWLFLGIYLAALLANGLIITAIACDHRLHTPMYFFLLNLSISDFGCISTTQPKAMANSLWDTRAISFSGCAAQVFWFLFFVVAEYYLLTIMAYDRYVAICKPLHYGTLLGSRACVHMAAAAWGGAFLTAVLHTASTFGIPLCQGNAVDQFFCEVPQILKLSCSHYYLREAGLLGVSFSLAVGCFVFIVVSYVQIFRAVLRIPSEQGRHKAFSTCLPHLAVVSLFISTAMFAYLKPPSISSPSLDPVVALFYSVVPPAVNPLIYSMRNQELKDALKKLIQSVIFQQI